MDFISSRPHLERFFGSDMDRATLALVYGRRRIGKSTLLERMTRERDGFYWEASRGESAIQLARLGRALGARVGTARLALEDWQEALHQLLLLGGEGGLPVVLDEFGYLLEAEPGLSSLVARALGPGSRSDTLGHTRLVVCGSAVAMMRALTAGEAPLRGRAGLELVMRPLDYRGALEHSGGSVDLGLAARVHAVVGGVIGYRTDMVDHDLPGSPEDFDRWIADRVLSPAATLHHEATTLLAEDPTLSVASPALHHSILGAIANGSVTAGTIANRLRRSVSSLDPAMKRLIAAGFVVRHEDPLRAQRPVYQLGDPFLQFHYAVLEPHSTLLRDRNPREVWERTLLATFDSRVRGPVFEEVARTWVRRYADPATLGGDPGHVGPSHTVIDGEEHQLDVVVTPVDDAGSAPAERTVLALGEAKAGERLEPRHLKRLEQARSALGTRAAHARLLLIGARISRALRNQAEKRADLELVELERLYEGG